MYRLEHALKSVSGVTPRIAKELAHLGLHTVEDMLYFFPFRYEEYTTPATLEQVQDNSFITFEGRIESIGMRKSKQRKMTMTEAVVSDGSATLRVVWFNQPYIAKQIHVGDFVTLSGKVSATRYGLQCTNPKYAKTARRKEALQYRGLTPVYHSTAELTQQQLRAITKQIIPSVSQAEEWLPREIMQRQKLMSITEALRHIHYPESIEQLNKTLHRLRFEELFLLVVQSAFIKQLRAHQTARAQTYHEEEMKAFVQELPFALTQDQKKAAWRVLQDLQESQPMNRLLEGDVGSGKTIVAAMALYHTSLEKQQGVMLAPTTLLARQHYATLRSLLDRHGIRVGIYTQGMRMIGDETVSREKMHKALKQGDLDVVVGTHALLGEEVVYASLGLVVIDEQHRFGVEQRKTLKERNREATAPHLLSMTATPIPRSLALVMYGELDVSLLREKPQGRQDVITRVVTKKEQREVYTKITQEIQKGRQVFVVCPLIDPSDVLGVTSVTQEYEKLKKKIFPGYAIEMLHGKLSNKEKETIMQRFEANEFPILVATSVIEVGIDIPNATVMMIEGAQRFGLAQLHQLRGRVGRSDMQSYCFLFANEEIGAQTQQRLHAMEQTHDGFTLAEYDLQLRGPGEVYGVRQSGLPPLKLAELTDMELVSSAKEEAEWFVKTQTNTTAPQAYKKIEQQRLTTHLE